jgi:hypothetical protein
MREDGSNSNGGGFDVNDCVVDTGILVLVLVRSNSSIVRG